MKVIKRILICLLILLAYYLFFGSGKTYAYYVGQTGLNIIFDNLIEYDPSQPYNCTQQGEKPLCGSASGGSHYYQVISRTWLYEISRTGSGASISSNTGKVSWKKYNDSTIPNRCVQSKLHRKCNKSCYKYRQRNSNIKK